MLRIITVVFLAVCLLLPACQTVVPSPLLEIQEQSAEDATIVFRAAIDKPGWLVLYRATSGGQPDASAELVHASLAEAGEYASITMTIGDAIIGDATVFAVLHYDDPADGGFTFTAVGTDDPQVSVEGEVVSVSFMVQGVSPYVEVQDEGVQDGTVTIKAAIDRPGWLVLHTATPEGEPDTAAVLSSTYLAAPAVYPGFEVTVPADVARTYFAVLYYDDPADSEFTFVTGGTDDPPVSVDGSAVEDAFTVGE